MPKRNSDETRDHRRRTIRVLVDYVSDHGVHCDYATTLGAGGLFLECEQPLPDESPLKLRFRLPGSEETHEIAGRVVWTRAGSEQLDQTPGMGIQFTDKVAAARLARELENLE
ncbi:MAG: PilZ domain-containing protein [Myxococcota bacterium]